jgi:hypothetical protein
MPSSSNTKRAAPSSQQTSSSTNSKRAATTANVKGCGKSKGTGGKKSGSTLSTLGFSLSKRPTIHVGTKLLLDESIYRKTKVPVAVKNHYFVYEVLQVHSNGKDITVLYKNQVIKKGGDAFRVYKDSDDAQVSLVCLIVCVCLSFFLFSQFLFLLSMCISTLLFCLNR